MRILYCVQRYGVDIIGGAEQHCRQLAERMVRRGHDVEVVTSCATNYSDWSNEFSPGTETINGVTVHRLPVAAPRDNERFSPLHVHLTQGKRAPLFDQKRWSRMIGPELVNYDRWIVDNARRFDVVVPFSYLYTTTTLALELLYGVIPTSIHATAHDEPMLRIPIFNTIMRWPDQFIFSTHEERELIERQFFRIDAGPVVGLGVDQDVTPTNDDVNSFRERHSLGHDPFFLYIGRADPVKGFHELVAMFRLFRERNRLPHKLVMIGGIDHDDEAPVGVHMLGYVSEEDKWAALKGALALIQPSYQESLSMVLCEAWSQETPVLVQNACEVLRGQTVRSGGGLRYANFAEFEQCLLWLTEDTDLAPRLGASGRQYVEQHYTWDVVMASYEHALEQTIRVFAERHPVPFPMPTLSR
jgi:glycosyltransferase involved in cell wall biosynthesis